MAVVIAFANQKGGVGKTTTTVNLAGAFSRNGLRTLVIDMDPQCHATRFFIPESPPASLTIAAIFEPQPDFRAGIVSPTRIPNLAIIPSSYDLAAITLEVAGRFDALRRLPALLDNSSLRRDYDAILIDCPPDLGAYTLNAFSAAQWIVTPCQPEAPSVDGFRFLAEKIATVRAFGVPVQHLGVIISMYDQRIASQKEWAGHLRRMFDRNILGEIHRAAQIHDVADRKRLLVEVDRKSRPYREHVAVAKEIAKRAGLVWGGNDDDDGEKN